MHLRHEFEEMKLSKERLQDEMGRLRMNYESDIAVVDEAAKTVGTGEGRVLSLSFDIHVSAELVLSYFTWMFSIL